LFALTSVAPHGDLARQRFNLFFIRSASAANSIAFEQFGKEHKKRDDQRGEELSDAQRCDERNRHGEFHCHAPFAEVFPCFLKNGIAAKECRGESQPVSAHEVFPPTSKTRDNYRRHQRQAHVFSECFFVFVDVPLLAVGLKMGITLAHRRKIPQFCSVSLKIVRNRSVETATLAELRRPDTIVVNPALSQNGLDDAATTRKMK